MLPSDTLPSLLAVVAAFPPIFYLWSVTTFERKAESPAVVVGLFMLGAVGAILYNSVVTPFIGYDLFWTDNAPLTALARVALLVALPGETLRWLVLIFVCHRFARYDHPMAGAVFGAAGGLGFAAVENVGYILVNLNQWQTVAFVRAVVTVPVHGALGAIAGIYVARARFRAVKRYHKPWRGYVRAWLVPVLLHGLYDFPFAFSRIYEAPGGDDALLLRGMGLAIGLMIFLVAAALTYRQNMLEDPEFQPHCLSPYLLRSPWRLFVLGGLLGLLGLIVLGAEGVAFWAGAEMSGRRTAMLALGLSLLVAVAVLHWYAWRLRMQPKKSTKQKDLPKGV